MKRSVTLLLHTSTPTARIGLADGGRLVARDEFPATREFASVLADRIRQFLQATSYQLQATDRVVVHAGPGGFTSLRIGVTTANALAYALGIPVVGVTGDIPDLETLLKKSNTAEPAKSSIVVPLYSKPPDIGPVPHRG